MEEEREAPNGKWTIKDREGRGSHPLAVTKEANGPKARLKLAQIARYLVSKLDRRTCLRTLAIGCGTQCRVTSTGYGSRNRKGTASRSQKQTTGQQRYFLCFRRAEMLTSDIPPKSETAAHQAHPRSPGLRAARRSPARTEQAMDPKILPPTPGGTAGLPPSGSSSSLLPLLLFIPR